MNKTIAIIITVNKIIAIIAIVAAAALIGCRKVEVEDDKDVDKAWRNHGMSCCTKVIEIEGHNYIIMDGPYSGCIIHAASCSCLSK